MYRLNLKKGVFLLVAGLVAVVGCRPQQPVFLFEDGDLSHYVDQATKIEYPDAEVDPLAEVENSLSPLTLENPDPTEIWDLSLQEAVEIALCNSKVMRNLGGVAFGATGTQGDPSGLLSTPSGAITTYDPAITSSDPRYGVEGALAAFDGQFAASVDWSKGDRQQNVAAIPTVQSDVGSFQAQLSKFSATGAQYALTHNWRYDMDNSSFLARRWPSSWYADLEGSVSQPLLQGRGVQFNRIAGPGAIPGFYNGVTIARLREDITLADFEAGVRNLVYDVERAYWNLYYAYRRLESVKIGRDSALQTWRQVYAKSVAGHEGGSAKDEAQSAQQYYIFRAEVERVLSNLYKTENILRYMMGISATDGRLIRPCEEPTTARMSYDWNMVMGEGLVRAVELRKQRWTVKQREMELLASRNFLLPRWDLTATYRVNGMGSDLIDSANNNPNAFGSMVNGSFAEWDLGTTFSLPFGFRKEMAGVRNAQLQLTKAKQVLKEQELELSHQLADSIRDIDEYYVVCQTLFNRYNKAVREVEATKAAYDQGTTTLDQVLDSQRRLAEAQTEYYRTLIDYNLAIEQLHYRKGSLLEHSNVMLSEGPWCEKAYFDALRLARSRDASIYMNYGYTRPGVYSRGEYNQFMGDGTSGVMDGVMGVEMVPVPDMVPGGQDGGMNGSGTIQPAPQPSLTPSGSPSDHPAMGRYPQGRTMTAVPYSNGLVNPLAMRANNGPVPTPSYASNNMQVGTPVNEIGVMDLIRGNRQSIPRGMSGRVAVPQPQQACPLQAGYQPGMASQPSPIRQVSYSSTMR